ncbi:D-sedoheptulose-7-phosphate isomerase [Otariodibacter oris]|uniref:D-sedoheptulose 7-phosphate isomerase n=1 Tax=Otariodibacter oris TaxID=1032623 RepID=A0A420XG70_9PAST|nr:SIS domain-containing protein [Otariodibacter oris]QGM80296.1 SIS domain-containing protein [Otariodibacter oris]RKR71664.1 D-sedoheptulose 7-phosphate isomerase [Otariodibacter oris]
MLDKIQDRFAESIQIQIATADVLPQSINTAANKIVNCLLTGHKVIVCGHGRSYINAQLLVSHLLHRYDLERPSLSAHLLHFDGVLASQLSQENNVQYIYKKQLQVVANKDDIFVAFLPIGDETCVLNAISYANSEDLTILAFTSSRNDHTQGLLGDGDVEISIPSNNEMRVIEGHLFCINLICELVDNLLFNPTSNY